MEEVPEMPSAKQQAWLENQMTQDQKHFFAENGCAWKALSAARNVGAL